MSIVSYRRVNLSRVRENVKKKKRVNFTAYDAYGVISAKVRCAERMFAKARICSERRLNRLLIVKNLSVIKGI